MQSKRRGTGRCWSRDRIDPTRVEVGDRDVRQENGAQKIHRTLGQSIEETVGDKFSTVYMRSEDQYYVRERDVCRETRSRDSYTQIVADRTTFETEHSFEVLDCAELL